MAHRATSALLSVLTVGACGGSSPAIPESRPEDYPPIKTVVVDASFKLEPLGAALFEFGIPEAEPAINVDVFATVDWTLPSNNVVAAFGGESCGDANLALAGKCTAGILLARPSLCPAKPRILTAIGTSGARLKLFVANTGASLESGRVQVVLCQDAPGCEAAAACSQCFSEKLRTESCQ
jgi:hypothetical protein